MSEVFLDTETTGLSFKDGHRIVEIACVETDDLIPIFIILILISIDQLILRQFLD